MMEAVIACDKREALAQGSQRVGAKRRPMTGSATKQSIDVESFLASLRSQ
jgi:hypothetical protein